MCVCCGGGGGGGGVNTETRLIPVKRKGHVTLKFMLSNLQW